MWSLFLACVSAVLPQEKTVPAAPVSALKFERAIAMPGVEGRIDHMGHSEVRDQVFVAARDHGTIENFEFKRGVARTPLKGPGQPQGIVCTSIFAFVADGETGQVWSFEVPVSIEQELMGHDHTRPPIPLMVGPDADNLRYLPRTVRLLVGYGEGALAFIGLGADTMELQHRIELGGHPESFQIDTAEKRCWVNVPSKQSIGVVDLEARKVLRWIEVKSAKKNYPMALAEKDKRLIIGCREPAKMLVFDIETDAMTAELPLSGDVDDIFVDEERGLVYASCGEGFVDVFERTAPGAWKVKEKVATSPGARTCLFVPSEKRLFVAVPHRGEQKAEVRVFSTAP